MRVLGSIISQAVLLDLAMISVFPIGSKTVNSKDSGATRAISNKDSRSRRYVRHEILLHKFAGWLLRAQEAFERKISKYEIVALVRDQSRDLISISSGAASVWAIGIDGPAAGRTLIEGSTGLRGK